MSTQEQVNRELAGLLAMVDPADGFHTRLCEVAKAFNRRPRKPRAYVSHIAGHQVVKSLDGELMPQRQRATHRQREPWPEFMQGRNRYVIPVIYRPMGLNGIGV